jgi:hypothetical protein
MITTSTIEDIFITAAISAVFLTSCSLHTASPPSITKQIEQTPPAVIPTPQRVSEEFVANKPVRKPGFWETIDSRTKQAGIQRLREIRLQDDDLEVRLWIGFGVKVLNGFVLKRTNDKWSAYHLSVNYDDPKHWRPTSVPLREPIIGWNKSWLSLVENNILTLPDATSINCEKPMLDGISYVVEIRKGENYRTYSYGNPELNKCAEARSMVAIADIIQRDYGVSDL